MKSIETVIQQAGRNWDERKELIENTLELIEHSKPLMDALDIADPKFIRKLKHFQGDITTHRINQALSKAYRDLL